VWVLKYLFWLSYFNTWHTCAYLLHLRLLGLFPLTTTAILCPQLHAIVTASIADVLLFALKHAVVRESHFQPSAPLATEKSERTKQKMWGTHCTSVTIAALLSYVVFISYLYIVINNYRFRAIKVRGKLNEHERSSPLSAISPSTILGLLLPHLFTAGVDVRALFENSKILAMEAICVALQCRSLIGMHKGLRERCLMMIYQSVIYSGKRNTVLCVVGEVSYKVK
jgi:hypothetical protein